MTHKPFSPVVGCEYMGTDGGKYLVLTTSARPIGSCKGPVVAQSLLSGVTYWFKADGGAVDAYCTALCAPKPPADVHYRVSYEKTSLLYNTIEAAHSCYLRKRNAALHRVTVVEGEAPVFEALSPAEISRFPC